MPAYEAFSGSPHFPEGFNEPADIMEATVAEILFDAYSSDGMQPISPWLDLDDVPLNAQRLSHDTFVAEVQTPQLVALLSSNRLSAKSHTALVGVLTALRADSGGAPSTFPEAAAMGPPWTGPTGAIQVEFDNHARPQRLLAHHHAQRGSLRPSPSQIHMGVQGETRRHRQRPTLRSGLLLGSRCGLRPDVC